VLVAALSGSSALGGQARGTMARWIAETPRLAALLDGAERLTDVAGRAPVTGRARAGFAPGAVLLGDAARATDPLTAGGLCHALVTAERLAAIVPRALGQGEADAALRRFDRDRRRLLRAPALLTDGLLALVRRPALARATLRLMRASPRVMQGLLGVAAGI
jgi:flavin-dependent dehydrogenase